MESPHEAAMVLSQIVRTFVHDFQVFRAFRGALPTLPSASHRILQGMPNSTSLVVALFPRLMAGYFAESRIVTKLITT